MCYKNRIVTFILLHNKTVLSEVTKRKYKKIFHLFYLTEKIFITIHESLPLV